MGDLFNKAFSKVWAPSYDNVNCPQDALIRGDNLTLDEQGVVSLRLGSSKYNAVAMPDTTVLGIHTVTFDGVTKRLAQAGSKLYVNEVDSGLGAFTGDTTQDFGFGSGYGMGFIARGTTKKKYDGTSFYNWGIPAPTYPAVVSATTTSTSSNYKSLCTFNSTDTPLFSVASPGAGTITATYPTGEDGEANGCLEITPNSNGAAIAYRTLTAVQDLSHLLGTTDAAESPDDWVEFSIYVERPQDINLLQIAFDISVGSNFFKDYYYARIASPQAIPPNTWTHFKFKRSQFIRGGHTSGQSWATVRAYQLYAIVKKGSKGKIRYDNLRFYSTAIVLADGTYKVWYRYARTFPGFIDLSPFSPASAEVVVGAQSLIASIPAAEVANIDPQVDSIWWYIEGGNLGGLYLAAVTEGTAGNLVRADTQFIDEFPRPHGVVNMYDRLRSLGVGITYPRGPVTGGQSLTTVLNISEIDILTLNELAFVEETRPPDNIKAVVGPVYNRMLALYKDTDDSSNKWLVGLSRQGRPGVFYPPHAVVVGDSTEIPYWMVQTSAAVFVGTSKDIIRIAGTLIELDDGSLDIDVRRLNINSPPISEAVATDGNFVIYMANDGWRSFDGNSSTLVPQTDIDLLYKGVSRHGVAAVDFTGRFRGVMSKNQLIAIVPEPGLTQSVHRYDFAKDRWYRYTYPFFIDSLHRDPLGNILAGDATGFVRKLDDPTATGDSNTAIDVTMYTKVDDDGSPGSRKQPYEIQIKSMGGQMTGALYIDGSASSADSFTIASAALEAIYKRRLDTLAVFRQIQLRLTGSVTSFRLYEFALSYRMAPQTRTFVDTGYVPTGRDYETWISEIRISAKSDYNLVVTPWFDDVAFTSQTVTVVAGKMTTYLVEMPRGYVGKQPRITVGTSQAAGAGEVGFELYWIEFKFVRVGNKGTVPTFKVDADGQAMVKTKPGITLGG